MADELFLPCLRGEIGDWVFYNCLMSFAEVASRISFAKELHPDNEQLSQMLQRELKLGRGKQISEYLRTQTSHFFNSLVVGVYGGAPEWFEFGKLRTFRPDIPIDSISKHAKNSLGFLRLAGGERLFALDGQHRLSGIKLAVNEEEALGKDGISVIFVGHENTSAGLERTRRLFTTLNKRAKAVRKGEIICLDEDDAMAICVRRLVELHPFFRGDRIAYKPTSNMPSNNRTSLTTIGNLYDVLKLLFTKVESPHRRTTRALCYYRPDDDTLRDLFNFAVEFFTLLRDKVQPLKRFFESRRFGSVTADNRGEFGGSIWFRPIGLTIMMEVVAQLSRNNTLKHSVECLSRLPHLLTDHPFEGILWDAGKGTIKKDSSNKVIARRCILYMLGYEDPNLDDLKQKYAIAYGEPSNTHLFDRHVRPVAET